MMSSFLQKIGHLLPNLPLVRALGNRVLWPIHKAMGFDGGIVEVLGTKMKLDPNECVDRNLWFTPQFYDQGEINFAIDVLKSGDLTENGNVFIDAGANIGFWSLQLASKLPNTRVIAIEANPTTASLLEENVALNNLTNIDVVQKGLGGNAGKFKLSCGAHGNRGGDSFKFHHVEGTEVLVDVITLEMLCDQKNIKEIQFMKMDIEGMEAEVLKTFFGNSLVTLHPKYMCLENIHDDEIDNLMKKYNYRLVKQYRENAIYCIE